MTWRSNFGQPSFGSNRRRELVLICAALAAGAGVSVAFTLITWPSPVSFAWFVAPALICGIFFDADANSRRVACRVVSAIIAVAALMFEPLGLLYLVPSAVLCWASFARPRDVPTPVLEATPRR